MLPQFDDLGRLAILMLCSAPQELFSSPIRKGYKCLPNHAVIGILQPHDVLVGMSRILTICVSLDWGMSFATKKPIERTNIKSWTSWWRQSGGSLDLTSR